MRTRTLRPLTLFLLLLAPPPVAVLALRWWARLVGAWLRPWVAALPPVLPFDTAPLPYRLYPLSCILLE